MQIDIFSDTICPWCYIGKKRLDRALAERPQPGLTIRWRAFQLNPDMAPEGMDRQAYLERKFGGAREAERVYAPVRAAGEEEGIAFAFERMKRTPNTLQSHRLIRWAERFDRQTPLVERLFEAAFLEAEDLGDPAVLAAAAGAAGLEREAAARFLAGEEEAEEVRAEDLRARMAGITGVPCFIFEGRYALPGAQPPEALLQMFDLAQQGELERAAAG
ncbi:MAG: DsbA family oxidoreductase [Tistlia sp.]|uniref:DsbA family oxidoreductase n=1 Tax=Tistlia sp. TaxID=3057121 RepID=UPI0034A27CF7